MNNNDISRRKFLHLSGTGLASAGAGLLLSGFVAKGSVYARSSRDAGNRNTLPRDGDGPAPAGGDRITAAEVIERIKKNVGVPWKTPTVDTIKGGNPGIAVTGITTTFMATLDVLQRSAAAGNNLVITHEPTFWNNLDLDEGLTDDALYLHKMDFINHHGLVVWRFHDHWHARRPDGIMEGQHRALGWDNYKKTESEQIRNGIFELPAPITLKAWAADVKSRLQSDNIRVIGDPGLKVSRVGNAANHLRGSVEALPFADAFIIKEADRENDLGEWCRDTVLSGQQKGFLFISHNRGEEFGMENCARWLRTFVPEAPVTFIPSGDTFWRTL